MKILFVSNSPDSVINFRKDVILMFLKKGFQVHISCPEVESLKTSQLKQCVLHDWSVSRHSLNPLTELRSLFGLFRIFSRVKTRSDL